MNNTLYFGTYTRRSSQGIYTATIDTQTGKMTAPELLLPAASPTYLTLHNKTLYSVESLNQQGGVLVLDDGQVFHKQEGRTSACYISYDPKRHLLYTANYHTGELVSYQADDLNVLDRYTSSTPPGPHDNQDQSHMHFASLAPDNYLVTCDLGTDEVLSFDINTRGQFSLVSRFQAPSGSGPRHLLFHPTEKVAYLLCELDSTVQAIFYDGQGEFQPFESYSTLPADFKDFNAPAAIRMSKDGRFLYISNRGHNSITCFSILADGSLSLNQIIPSNGDFPRDFNLTTDDRLLICTHQHSDNLSIFERDSDNGRLKLLSDNDMVPEAVCLVCQG